MQIDLALLRVVKYKEQLSKVQGYIPKSEAVNKRTRVIVKDIERYFEMNPTEEKVDLEVFRSLFFTSWHKIMKDEETDYYNNVLERMEADVSESASNNLVNMLIELEFATEVANVIKDFDQGDDMEVIDVVQSITERAQSLTVSSSVLDFADLDDNDLDKDDRNGIPWMLPCLQASYRPCQGGDLYLICARPGKGKTSFLTHMNYGFAQHLPVEKKIYWFNNEGRKQRIIQRQIQSALDETTVEVRASKADGTMHEKYIDAMGCIDRVRVFDIHDKSNIDLQKMLELAPDDGIGAIIFDMLDNVEYLTRSDLRLDTKLEKLYQWARTLGVKYDCPVFATSQISTEGDGLLYPTEGMLKDSKTGKQGTGDGIIMLGCANNPLLPFERGISMPKEKCKLPGQPHVYRTLVFDQDRGRYLEEIPPDRLQEFMNNE